jgi:transposase
MDARHAALRLGSLSETPAWLYVSFELSLKHWVLTFSNGARYTQRRVSGGDFAAVAAALKWAKQRLGLAADCEVLSCYEAGREGFHVHRWLEGLGVKNLVVDSASIETDRRARRVKTDGVDGKKLLSLLIRYAAGERKHFRVVRVPSVGEEDERRVHRERERLGQEATAHRNRIRGLLFAQGVRVEQIGGRGFRERLEKLGIEAHLRAELKRETERLVLVQAQLKALEQSRQQRLGAKEKDRAMAQVKQLLGLGAVGINSAWVLVMEFFAWRAFRNRRELGSLSGLVPTPYNSGSQVREQGISKAGNRRVRALLIELAWQWLRHQPQSALAQWFNVRFSGGGSRTRRIGIVALARKLLVALWRYLEHGALPAGARLKAAA